MNGFITTRITTAIIRMRTTITAIGGIHLGGVALVKPFSMGGWLVPAQGWAGGPGRPALGRVSLGLRVEDEVSVADRVVARGELEEAVEDEPAAANAGG